MFQPKSTIQNWSREFNQWTPNANIVVLTGTMKERADTITNRLTPQDFEVCITGYEIYLIEKPAFKQFSFELYYHWQRALIKNVDSLLFFVCSSPTGGCSLHAPRCRLSSLNRLFWPLYSWRSSWTVRRMKKGWVRKWLRWVKRNVEKNLLPSTSVAFIVYWVVTDFYLRILQKKRLTSTSAWRRYCVNGVVRSWRKMSTLSMVITAWFSILSFT